MSLAEFHFTHVSWSSAAGEIIELRKKVFVIEQRFDETSLYDKHDLNSQHVLVTNQFNKSIGCGRLTEEGKIGQIAVLIDHRGQGIGSRILQKLTEIAQKFQITDLSISTETDLVHFYDQQQFHTDGPVYMKKGVPFQRMVKHLA